MADTTTPPAQQMMPYAPELAGALGVYVTGEDHIRVTSYGALASVVVAIDGRFTFCDGSVVPIAELHTPNSDRTAATSIIKLARGYVSNIQARIASGSPKRGQVYVIVELVRGTASNAIPLGTLIADYIATGGRVAWPGSPVRSSLDGPGMLRSITGTDPAAGSELSETVPTGARWRLRALRASLVTSAVVANRTVVLFVDDGATAYWTSASPTTQPASQTVPYTVGVIGTSVNQQGAIYLDVPYGGLVLPAGHRIRTVTSLLDAGDNWGAPQYQVEEWLEP